MNQPLKFASLFAAAALMAACSSTGGNPSVPYAKAGAATDVVRSGNGLCWRTGSWTPAEATCECDKDILPAAKCAPPAPPVAVVPATPATPATPAAPALPSSEKVTYSADAFFDFDKSVLKPEGRSALDDLVSKLGGVNLEVIIAVGHTDSVGTDAYNQALSVRRADAVKAYLTGKGIEANRVYTEGKGESQPVADNKTAEGRAKNRRVEIEVVGTRPAKK
ncbi:OmpA family protein [soil metagenome]